MTFSIDQLITPATADGLMNDMISTLVSLGVPANSWRIGGAARTILKTVAMKIAGYTQVQSDAIRAGFLETSTGNWLTLLARNVYGIERSASTAATGTITFTNTGGGVYPPTGTYAPGQVTVTWTAGKKQYVNTATFSLAGGQTLDVPFTAIETGSASSTGPGTITELTTSMLGVTITNALSFAGLDAESDNALQQRCRNRLGSLSPNGPRGAYAYAATSALRIDGTPVNINRVAISPSSSTGVVNVYCAAPSGTPITSDLTQVAANIETIARPDSVTVNVIGATSVALTASLTLWMRQTPGVQPSDIATLAQNALTNMVAVYPIGGIAKTGSTQGYLYADNVAGTAKSVHPAIFDVDGISADLPLSPGQVPALATTITVRVVNV